MRIRGINEVVVDGLDVVGLVWLGKDRRIGHGWV
jgi:hypothetical protein